MKTKKKELKEKIEKKLITLEKIKCPLEVKRRLRKAARDWIKFIKKHIYEMHKKSFFEEYHMGEIAFIELFFNIPKK